MKIPFMKNKKKEEKEVLIKYSYEDVKLKNCHLCGTSPEIRCWPSDCFNYRIEIECKKCSLLFSKWGNRDYPGIFRPEQFKLDWDNFINSWNLINDKENK